MKRIIPSDIPLGKYYVYSLSYPESMGGTVFYVGQGTGRRIDDHEWEAKQDKYPPRANRYKIGTIRKIWAHGEEVVKRKLAYFMTHEEACLYEIALIFFLPNLTNLTGGGDGMFDIPEEVRKKISEANKRRPPMAEETRQKLREIRAKQVITEEHRRKITEANRGKKMSEEHRQKLKGRTMSEETRQKLSEAHKGKSKHPHTEEARRNMSEAQKARASTPEGKRNLEKLRESRIGTKHSEESKQKMREATAKQVWSEESKRKRIETWKAKKNARLSSETSP